MMKEHGMSRVRLFIMDVDGTLTDGTIYMSASGEMFKAFNIKDGYGIHEILPAWGIVPVILTGRQSEIVGKRAAELGIEEVHQGKHDKKKTLELLSENYGCSFGNMAYIGDDILDLPCMISIKEAGGLTGCPADAVEDVKKISDYVSPQNGGEGAVRDFIEWILQDWKQAGGNREGGL